MAAKHFYQHGFLLFLFNFISASALEKRFSDFKRCADEECSMLLCRGKAVRDFSGPDCRFLSFKKSETIYVYYKLSGRRADLWAGSVGSNFGYFPKNLLSLNHVYTDKELEVPAEETDFVCFDTGYDKFDSYDIDLLLGLTVEKDSLNNGTIEQIQETESNKAGAQPSGEDMTKSEEQAEHHDFSDNIDNVPDNQSASLAEADMSVESPLIKDIESDTEGGKFEQKQELKSAVEHVSDGRETEDVQTKSEMESISKSDFFSEKEPVTISKGAQIPELKTTLGTTFDAVTTDEEITTKVSPYEEEDSESMEEHSEDVNNKEEIPLLSFSEEKEDTPDSLIKEKSSSPTQDAKPNTTEEKNMWTSLGDAVFSVVTGGETTAEDVSSDEDDDDDDDDDDEEYLEEESAGKKTQIFEKMKKEPLISEPQKDTPLFDSEDEHDLKATEEVETVAETFSPSDEPIHNQTEENISVDPVLHDDTFRNPDEEKLDIKTAHEPTQHKEQKEVEKAVFRHTEVNGSDANIQDSNAIMDQDLENKTVADEELVITTRGKDLDISTETSQSQDSGINDTVDERRSDQMHDQLVTDLESNNSHAELSEEEIQEQLEMERRDDEKDVDDHEEKEELLEDENALSVSQSVDAHSDKPSPEAAPSTDSTPEPEYSDSIMRLTLLRDHFTEKKMERVQKLLGLKSLFKVESMFSDLDTELQAARLTHAGTTQEIESALESILETSENAILDEIEKMLDSQDAKRYIDNNVDTSSVDEETELLDDFQELAFSLRQKYSTASDSAPLATGKSSYNVEDEAPFNVKEDTPHAVEDKSDNMPEAIQDDNLTVTDREEVQDDAEEWPIVSEEVPSRPDVGVEEDAGHFNKNKDEQPSFSASDEEKLPKDTLENPVDMDIGAEVEHSFSGSKDSMESVTEMHEEEAGLFITGVVYMGCILSIIRNKTAEWTTVIISLLPDEWKPGETLYGCPWQAVFITALVGVLTFTLFFWRTVLAVKKKEYLVDEKKLTEQIQALKKEKNDAHAKISELQRQTEELKEKQKQSKETVSCTAKKMQNLESKVLEAEKLKEQMAEERSRYAKLLEDERAISLQNETRIQKLEKSNEKLQLSRKKIQEAFAKTTILLDEAKLREDARNAQHKCLEKEFSALKEENKTLKAAIKGWEEKHKELNEKIKVYQKSQKELEDSVVLKDHNIEVLSELLADLDACDLQKGDTKVLANGEVVADKKTAIRNRIKQMMDVSRIQTTVTVVEEERDRFMAKLLNEEKFRKELEEQHQELEHAIGALKSEKSHVENQYRILQQKNEIMVEMYQQKENALQQRLTKEELERRSKENLLSEVGGKALEAEEQVKLLRQRINEMEEQMKKTEEVYKEQIKEQENKTHSNWVNARNAERALSQEKVESSKLREKLAVLTSQLNERRAPLFRPNSGQPAGPRQGDSYGPSPVSGGAPSPPLMIEGPRRPPSAPVGRRIDPYGPRPPSDPHGRYPENKHIPGMDMTGPRSSSPANLDGSTQAVDPQIKAETQAVASTESPEPGPGSFLASPIRDSPGPMLQGPPPGPGPHDPMLPPGPHVRLPPPGPYRPPRPGPYQLPPGPLPPNLPPPLHGPPLPANGHPGLPLPGPMGGEFGPRPANGHVFHPRPGPGPLIDPRGPPPPPPHFRPPPSHPFGPMPPPHGVRGPMGPRPPIPPDMRFPGPRDHFGPPMDLPPGVPPHPAHPGNAYGQAAPSDQQNSGGVQSGPSQDLHVKQDTTQDSTRPAMVQP